MANNSKLAAKILSAEAKEAVEEAIRASVKPGTYGAPAYLNRRVAQYRAEQDALEDWISQNPGCQVEIVENRPVEFRVIELAYQPKASRIGTVAGYSQVEPGTIAASLEDRIKVRKGTMTKHCTAQYVEGLCESVIVLRLPSYRLDGEELPIEDREQMLRSWLKENNRLMVWTQSSIKPNGVDRSVTLYTLPVDVAKEAMEGLDLREAANYWPLIFSECDSRPGFKITMNVGDPVDGHDGNGICHPAFFPRNCQFRAVEPNGRKVKSVAKGTKSPNSSAGAPVFDTNQVKFGGKGQHTFYVLRNDGVEADKVTRVQYASAMLSTNLRHTPAVEAWAVKAVRTQVRELLDLMLPENRAKLAQRWGGLSFEDYELSTIKNAAIDMLMANVPYSAEFAEVLGRVCVSQIVEAIVPSCGVKGRSSLIFQSDKYGQGETANGTVIVAGMPSLTPAEFKLLPKSSFKPGMGMVIQSKVVTAMNRDSDGDNAIEIAAKEDVAMISANFLRGIDPAIKPEKAKKTGEATERTLYVEGCKVASQSWIVGTATVCYWKAVQQLNVVLNSGDDKAADYWRKVAGRYAWAATTAPMTFKHKIVVDGQEFSVWFGTFHREHKAEMQEITLAWRDAQLKSKGWKSPRDMAKAHIAKPVSLIDVVWNAACDEAAQWVKANPQTEFQATDVADTAWTRMEEQIPFSAIAEARAKANEWNAHWHIDPIDRGGKLGDKAMREKMVNFFRNAPDEVVAAAMTLRTKAGGPMWGFKVNAAKAGRLTRVLGLHPQVAELAIKMYPDLADAPSFMALTKNTGE